jgi:adenine deaminase
MLNHFSKHPLWECHATLIRVAQGKEPADIVLRHATLVSVTTHELLEDADIAIAQGRIAYIGG